MTGFATTCAGSGAATARAAGLATRLAGSADLYQGNGRRPAHSINFITCHDGFTLSDLVSYAAKHNHANGEGNRDGSDDNLSANYGVEGPTDDPAIGAIRLRQSKNLLATLFLSLGTPLLLGGDERARTQRGNNNAYCHDNELSWFDWTATETGEELGRFCRALAALRGVAPGAAPRRILCADSSRRRGSALVRARRRPPRLELP